MMLAPDHELRAALRTVPDQTERTQRTPIVGVPCHRAGSLASWLAACKFGELGTMVAGIAAHLLMQDALTALLAAEPLPVAVD